MISNAIAEIRTLIRNVLAEGIVDDLKKKFAGSWYSQYIDIYASEIPLKYVPWAMYQHELNNVTDGYEGVISAIKAFHARSDAFTSKDINKYKTYEQLKAEVKKLAPSKRSKRKNDKQGAVKVGSIGRFDVYRIDTREASMTYGAGTTWCIAMATTNHYWNMYTSTSIVFFVIDTVTSEKFCVLYSLPLINQLTGNDGESYKAYSAIDEQFSDLRSAISAIINEPNVFTEKDETKLLSIMKKASSGAPLTKLYTGELSDDDKQKLLSSNPDLKSAWDWISPKIGAQ